MPWSEWHDPVEVVLGSPTINPRYYVYTTLSQYGSNVSILPSIGAGQSALAAAMASAYTADIINPGYSTGYISHGLTQDEAHWAMDMNTEYIGWPMNAYNKVAVSGHQSELLVHPSINYGCTQGDMSYPNPHDVYQYNGGPRLPITHPTTKNTSHYSFLGKLLPGYAELKFGTDYGVKMFSDGVMRTIEYEDDTFTSTKFDFKVSLIVNPFKLTSPPEFTAEVKTLASWPGKTLAPGEGNLVWNGTSTATFDVSTPSFPPDFQGCRISTFLDPSTVVPETYESWGATYWSGRVSWTMHIGPDSGYEYRFITPRFRYWIPPTKTPIDVSLPNKDWVPMFGDGRARLKTAQGWVQEDPKGKPLLLWDGAEWVEVTRMQ